MTTEDKLEKVTKDFTLLPAEKQDYVLGIMQALAFANAVENDQNETVPSNLEQNAESG